MMKNNQCIIDCKETTGFTLPIVIVVMAALFILAIGILLVTSIERNVSHSFADFQRAELAARAGLEEFRSIINLEATNDDFLIIQSDPLRPITEGSLSPPQLFLARGEIAGESCRYRYIPLFSTNKTTIPTAKLTPPSIEYYEEENPNEMIHFTSMPCYDKVRVSWLPIFDDQAKMIARYAYWVEDLQNRLDPAMIGNEKGKNGDHVREPWPFPAPGLNAAEETEEEPMLDQVALYAVDPEATNDEQGILGKTLTKNRQLMISPDSLLAAADFSPPIHRIKDISDGTLGELVDAKARMVEKALVTELRSYKEQPLVPFVDGISPSVAGMPKINLNELLEMGSHRAVDRMAAFIKEALPNFVERKGGFPDDYLKTLAANTIDYADKDSDSTTKTKTYRGIDSFPLVSEFLMKFRWESNSVVGGRQYAEIIVTTYAELWNMTDQLVSGEIKFTHDTRYQLYVAGSLKGSLEDMSTTRPILEQEDGSYWFPARTVTLNPNQYVLLNCGELKYKIELGPSSPQIEKITLEDESSHVNYKLKWNGQVIDHARGNINRRDCELHLPKIPPVDPEKKPRQQVRATVPAQRYIVHQPQYNSPANLHQNFRENMGDPRMSFYYSLRQEAIAYPENYSPNRRNILWKSYIKDQDDLHGCVMPAEWPDGGHNSTCGSSDALSQTEILLNPDDPIFYPSTNSELFNPPRVEAPTRISNRGRFYSATELGRIYDPIMWKVEPPPHRNMTWGEVTTSCNADSDFGGGNTLRIGRPEHPKFDLEKKPGQHAGRLLDLFHVGLSRSPE
jgi:hypothetical protein